jgi:hypothetical protein
MNPKKVFKLIWQTNERSIINVSLGILLQDLAFIVCMQPVYAINARSCRLRGINLIGPVSWFSTKIGTGDTLFFCFGQLVIQKG